MMTLLLQWTSDNCLSHCLHLTTDLHGKTIIKVSIEKIKYNLKTEFDDTSL